MVSDYLSAYRKILRDRPLPPPPSHIDDQIRQIEELRKTLEAKDQALAEEECTQYQAETQSLEGERAEKQRLFDAALDGFTHDAARQEIQDSFSKILDSCYQQKKRDLSKKYERIERERVSNYRAEERTLNEEIYQRILSRRGKSMITSSIQEKKQPLQTLDIVALRTPAETPPLDSSSPNSGRQQSASDTGINPSSNPPASTLTGPHQADVCLPPLVGQSDGVSPAMTTFQKVITSGLPPSNVPLTTLQTANSDTLKPVPPVEVDDSIVHEGVFQAKIFSKRACNDHVSPSKTKRIRLEADNSMKDTPSIDAEAEAGYQVPVSRVDNDPKTSNAANTTRPNNAQDLEVPQNSIVLTPANSYLSNEDKDLPNETLEQHENAESPRTITMEEILGDKSYGQQRYHFIIQEDGNFWIVKCTEHGVHFGKNAKQGAAKHLSGKAHGLSRKRDLVLKHLGYRVTDCTEKLARENNEEFEAQLSKGYKPLNMIQHKNQELIKAEDQFASPRVESQTQKPPKGEQKEFKQTLQPSSLHVTQPLAGNLYVGYIEWKRAYYSVRILPLAADVNDPGLPPVGKTELWTTCPPCYVANGPDDIRWAPDYEDNGPRVDERVYPVVVFDGEQSKEWLPVASLRPFDFENRDKKVCRWARARNEFARLRGFKDYPHMKADLGGIRTKGRLSEYPIPGKMYATNYNDSGVFGVMVLPWLPTLAKNCSKAVSDLMDRLVTVESENGSIPECYLTTAESTISGWAPGYEDDGPEVTERFYPVRWFDPEKNIGWVAGSALLGFDFENEYCGNEIIQRFAQAKTEYAKILGYRRYADMKAKLGVPETMLRPISAGIISDSDPESEAGDKDDSDTEMGGMERQAAEKGMGEMDVDADVDGNVDVDVDVDEETTGAGFHADMQKDLDVDHQQAASIVSNSESGGTTISNSAETVGISQTASATNAATAAAELVQPPAEEAPVATSAGIAVPTEETTEDGTADSEQSTPVRTIADVRAQSVDGNGSTGLIRSAQHKVTDKQPVRATSVPSVVPAAHIEVDRAQDLERMRCASLKLKKKPPYIGQRRNSLVIPVMNKPGNFERVPTDTPPSIRQTPHPSTTAAETTESPRISSISLPQTSILVPATTIGKTQATKSQPGSSETRSAADSSCIATAASPKPSTHPQAPARVPAPDLGLPCRPNVIAPSNRIVADLQALQSLTREFVAAVSPPISSGLPAKPAAINLPKTVGNAESLAKPASPKPTSKPVFAKVPAKPVTIGPASRAIDVGARMPVAPMAVMHQPVARTETSPPASEERVEGESRVSAPMQQSLTSESFLMRAARNALEAAKPAKTAEPTKAAKPAGAPSTKTAEKLMVHAVVSDAPNEAGSNPTEAPTMGRAHLSIDTGLVYNEPTIAPLTPLTTPSLSALRKQLDSEPLMLCGYSSAATEAQLAENQQTFATESLYVAIDHRHDIVTSVPGSAVAISIRPKQVKRFVMERLDDGTGRATVFVRGDGPVQRLHFANMPGEKNDKILPGWRSCGFIRGYLEGFDVGVVIERI